MRLGQTSPVASRPSLRVSALPFHLHHPPDVEASSPARYPSSVSWKRRAQQLRPSQRSACDRRIGRLAPAQPCGLDPSLATSTSTSFTSPTTRPRHLTALSTLSAAYTGTLSQHPVVIATAIAARGIVSANISALRAPHRPNEPVWRATREWREWRR